MKFLVVFTGLLASAFATPLEPGYGLPAAPPVAVAVSPIETVTIPIAPTVVEPPFLFRSAAGPFAPSPVARVLNPAPLPFNRRFLGAAPVPLPLNRQFLGAAPVPSALPVPLAAPAVPLPRALPVPVGAPVPRSFPLPAAAPVPRALPLPAAPAPFARALPFPSPAAAGPVPLPLSTSVPAPLPLSLVRSPVAALTPAPVAIPSSQFHAQDEFGGFNFGYQNQDSGRQEIHTPDGVTRGSYSYVDAYGLPQTVNYIADAAGFRVQATNLPVAPIAGAPGVVAVPQDTVEVRAAKAEFQAAFDRAVAQAEAEAVLEIVQAEEAPLILPLSRAKRQAVLTEGYGIPAAPVFVASPTPAVVETRRLVSAPITPLVRTISPVSPVAPFPAPLARPFPATGLLPVGPAPIFPGAVRTIPEVAATVRTPLTATAPFPVPLVNQAVIPATPVVNSQFHAQDELGGFSFGYQGLTSGRQESRTPDGVTRGSYSYVDANGIIQTVNYVADALGFRVAATNLPVAPEA